MPRETRTQIKISMQLLSPRFLIPTRDGRRLTPQIAIAAAVGFLLSCGSVWGSGPSTSTNATTWRLASDDTEIALALQGDSPSLMSLRSTVSHHNWLMAPQKEPLMETIEIGGTVKKLAWKFRGADSNSQNGEITFHYENSDPKLSLDSFWRARPGHGPAEHWVKIVNQSDQTITVHRQGSLDLSGLTPPRGENIHAWWINRGGGNASKEGGTSVEDISANFDKQIISDPLNGSSPVPWMSFQAGDNQGGIYVGWEFSGVGAIHAKTAKADPLVFGVNIGLVPDFKTDVGTGGTYLAPPAFVGCYVGDIDDGSYSLHRFILEKLLPPLPPGRPYPTLAYNLYLDVGGNKANESDVLSSAAFCRSLGFETFLPDAMWFPKDGDWRWDAARFPHGVQPIDQFTHQNGMDLGLWVAWTHGGDSPAPEALNISNHPDWFNEELPPSWKPQDINWTPLIDLGYDPARDWATKEVQRIVRDNRLDYLKHDFSPIVTQCVQANHRHRYGVDASYWSTLGYYHVMETLKRQYPKLVLEGCSGGGHIKDFGYIQRVHSIVTTDTLSSLPDRQSIYDSTYAFPPAVLMAYTYENFYNKESDKPRPYLWRSAMMGAWQIDPTHTADWNPDDIASARHAAEIYKTWIRPILKDAQVHHILPRPDDSHWDGIFYWSPSMRRGTVYMFRPNNDQATQRVPLKGLSPRGRYRVRSEDGSVSPQTQQGKELMGGGLEIRLPDKYSSDLIYIEQY
jgi:hypothetical protein